MFEKRGGLWLPGPVCRLTIVALFKKEKQHQPEGIGGIGGNRGRQVPED